MRIGLFDIDQKYPNLALMKISAYHKSLGDEVFLNWYLGPFNKTYVSCVFTWNKKKAKRLAWHSEIGGSGIDLIKTLPDDIEKLSPDYALYGIKHGLGFISRGCIRKCKFCIVPQKEGKLRQVAEIGELLNPLSNELILMDNNFLGLENAINLLNEMRNRHLKVDFNQGLDIRLIDDDKARALSEVRPLKQWRFSFDSLKYEREFKRGMNIIKKYINPARLMIFVLVGFDTGWEEDIERFGIVKSYGADTFFMLYRNSNGQYSNSNYADMPPYLMEKIFKTQRTPQGNIKKIVRLFSRPAATKAIWKGWGKKGPL